MHSTDIYGLYLGRNLKDVLKFSISLASLKHLNFVTIKGKCSQTGRTADLSPRGIKADRVSLPAQSTIVQS